MFDSDPGASPTDRDRARTDRHREHWLAPTCRPSRIVPPGGGEGPAWHPRRERLAKPPKPRREPGCSRKLEGGISNFGFRISEIGVAENPSCTSVKARQPSFEENTEPGKLFRASNFRKVAARFRRGGKRFWTLPSINNPC